ncbi:anti-sigma factor RsbW [Mycolicibacterium canariasense]|uniref:Anti-sigma factor RsbW n=1 Tax=Mycolicibacterium canariasense TaxID=228230 RepID=A0A117I986_MYCCR|nr:hypothetical protein [Mycolicibacterium canariasense]MCV7208801.1 hypothetical protein [Mycolicibacterium canariasense]ORV07133.1 hypothetical protein AWB94_14115 [Mycolicibacterium canariasense]GAS94412.1 anti-sigma factor RsbW [Mycolicibacterium canariasense]
MSNDRIASVRIYVTTTEGNAYEADAIVDTRAELRLAIARLGALIEDEMADVLDGEPVSVEQDDPDSSTQVFANPRDINATIVSPAAGDDPGIWLPNDDGFGDGSRIYADQLADTIAVIHRAAAIIHDRKQR